MKMKLSIKSEYGFLAILDLANHSNSDPVQIQQIAQRQAIPKQFLDQILLNLKKAGLVSSTRGRQGGYSLAKSATEIKLVDIFQALEGPMETRQFRRRAGRGANPCQEVLGEYWRNLVARQIEFLNATTLDQLCDRVRRSQEHPMYYI
jgi:Rrf2 family cysteine metabolism transcriptional repressor